MTDLRQAAQAVLDRWNSPHWEWVKNGPTADLMHALREALAAPMQEPVAVFDERLGEPVLLSGAPMLSDGQPLYTAPPRREWEPLSFDQINKSWSRAYPTQPLSQAALNFARDIEQALKERNHE